jgi:hypothetical protein
MYLKVVFKRTNKEGHRVMQYRMVESYRTNGTVKHQNILHLGTLEELPEPEQKKELGRRIDEIIKERVMGRVGIFNSADLKVEELANAFAKEIIEKNKIDVSQSKSYELIDTDAISHHDIVEIGSEWLCKQALDQLHFQEALKTCNWPDEDIQLAYTHIISRAVNPASELATAGWIKQNSGICELTGYPVEKITKDKLYGISHKLYSIKDALEKHLSTKTNELFDLDDKIIIYDLTNTYFEGRMEHSELAKFGRSKEKRNDAKLIVLGLVINEQGFIKYSRIFEGNMSDSKSMLTLVEELSVSTSAQNRKPTIVMDAGIASEDNLTLLKTNGYDYMCVSRSQKTNYKIDTSTTPATITDKKGQTITLKKVKIEENEDTFIEVHSQAKALKEQSMNKLFKERFIKGLEEINEGLTKKRGTKTVEKVSERIGRLKQKYPSINKHFEITLEKENEIVKQIKYQENQSPKNEGYYLLRTTLDSNQEEIQWKIYNVIREVEATFRVLKTDLDLRPVYHKTDQASKAHLHLGILAYWLVSTIRYQLKKENINTQWSDIVKTMNTQKIVTTKLQGPNNLQIKIRKCSIPNQQVEQIYKKLGYKSKPFNQRKFVVPPN